MNPQNPYEQDFWKWILDQNSMMITELEYRLRGYYMDDDGNWKRLKDADGNNAKTLVNELGARELSNELRHATNPSLSMTDLEEDEIHEMTYNFIRSIIKKLALNYQKYQLSKSDLISGCITRQMHDIYYSIISQSKKGGLRFAISQQLQRHEIINRTENITPKRGFLGLPIGGRQEGQN